jgi:hypothetical membrane protein
MRPALRPADSMTTSLSKPRSVRRVRIGGLALLVGSVQFVVAMAVTQFGWTTPYSLLTNYISDLGAAHCGYWTGTDPRYICSPWHVVFDTSIVLLGLLTIAAALLIYRAFRDNRVTILGLILFALTGAGAIGVGLSPEDVDLRVHTLSALLAFAAGNSSLLVLGVSIWRDARWHRAFGGLSLAAGLTGWTALVLFVIDRWGALGPGGMERIVVAPVLLWAAVIGVRLMRIPSVGGPRQVTVGPNG